MDPIGNILVGWKDNQIGRHTRDLWTTSRALERLFSAARWKEAQYRETALQTFRALAPLYRLR